LIKEELCRLKGLDGLFESGLLRKYNITYRQELIKKYQEFVKVLS
tara:strand:- start:168 stop:302 length:135 start_codon:yes stop_codon:yes gene_type:complete